MQIRVSIGLVVAIILTGLAPFAASPAKAQSRDRDGVHSYCDRRARDYARRHASGGVIGGAAEGAIRGAIIGGILGGRRGARRAEPLVGCFAK